MKWLSERKSSGLPWPRVGVGHSQPYPKSSLVSQQPTVLVFYKMRRFHYAFIAAGLLINYLSSQLLKTLTFSRLTKMGPSLSGGAGLSTVCRRELV
jgi:hypothetical protein